MNFVHISAHDDGNSYFTDETWHLFEGAFTPPSPAGYAVTETIPATGVLMMHHPAGYQDEWHCAPAPVLGTVLTGAVRILTSDGDSRVLTSGDQFLAADLNGLGHKMEEVDAGPYDLALAVLSSVPASSAREGK